MIIKINIERERNQYQLSNLPAQKTGDRHQQAVKEKKPQPSASGESALFESRIKK